MPGIGGIVGAGNASNKLSAKAHQSLSSEAKLLEGTQKGALRKPQSFEKIKWLYLRLHTTHALDFGTVYKILLPSFAVPKNKCVGCV